MWFPRILWPMKWGVIIVAAGSGQRFGGDIPKQYARLGGRPVLQWSLEALRGIGEVVAVVDPAHAPHYAPLLNGATAIPGGATRQDSVLAGLRGFKTRPDFVLIHDGARPFPPMDCVHALKEAIEGGAKSGTLAVPVADTLVRGVDIVDRKGLHAIQTPQAFAYDAILKAHEQAKTAYTDDTSLVFGELGIAARLVPGCPDNFKLTNANELEWAERLVRADFGETRTGLGLDFHRFGPHAAGADEKVRLFGVDIPSPQCLVGHSDADAGLHAVADAILGSIGAGDIGVLFPPSDPQWKGMDSAVIVEKAMSLLRERGGMLVNTDIMLMSEFPRIGPHRDAIVARLSDILGLKPDAIGLKATTTEQMGFIGRGEGLAVQAVVTVRLKGA